LQIALESSCRSHNFDLSDLCRNLGERVLLKVKAVSVELADTFSEFLGSHSVFVVHPPEGLLVQVETIAK